MHRASSLSAVLLTALVTSVAAAQPTPEVPKAAGKPEASAKRTSFADSLAAGDQAYRAKDFDAALTAYQQAQSAEPKNPSVPYRLGQVQIAKGDLKQAEAAYLAALKLAGADHAPLKAKLLFVLADVRERMKSYNDALVDWTKYGSFAKEHADVKAFPQTAAERKKRLGEYDKLVSEYAAVKARIDKRLQEADERARKSAK
jgi:tetratricopeptide (TPR) repeat protein